MRLSHLLWTLALAGASSVTAGAAEPPDVAPEPTPPTPLAPSEGAPEGAPGPPTEASAPADDVEASGDDVETPGDETDDDVETPGDETAPETDAPLAASGRVGDAEPEPTRTVPGKYIEKEPVERGPEPLPVGRDTLGGHVQIGVTGAWAVPFGSVESGASQSDLFSTGGAFGLDLGLGLSRTTVIGLAADYDVWPADARCEGCAASALGAGLFVRYHLVQGLSFDPWMSFGVGYRQLSLDDGPSLSGLDWAKLHVGGDWYPIDNLGLGPVLGLTLTSFLSKSEGDFAGASVAAAFTLGGRLVFDTPGK